MKIFSYLYLACCFLFSRTNIDAQCAVRSSIYGPVSSCTVTQSCLLESRYNTSTGKWRVPITVQRGGAIKKSDLELSKMIDTVNAIFSRNNIPISYFIQDKIDINLITADQSSFGPTNFEVNSINLILVDEIIGGDTGTTGFTDFGNSSRPPIIIIKQFDSEYNSIIYPYIVTLAHELGHALGLFHPHEKDLGSNPCDPFDGIYDTAPFAYEGSNIMSYSSTRSEFSDCQRAKMLDVLKECLNYLCSPPGKPTIKIAGKVVTDVTLNINTTIAFPSLFAELDSKNKTNTGNYVTWSVQQPNGKIQEISRGSEFNLHNNALLFDNPGHYKIYAVDQGIYNPECKSDPTIIDVHVVNVKLTAIPDIPTIAAPGTNFVHRIKLENQIGGFITPLPNEKIYIFDPIAMNEHEIYTDNQGIAIYTTNVSNSAVPSCYTFQFSSDKYNLNAFSNVSVFGETENIIFPMEVKNLNGTIQEINDNSFQSRLFNYLSRKHPDVNQNMLNLLGVDFIDYIKDDVNEILSVAGKIKDAAIDEVNSESNQIILATTIGYCTQYDAANCALGVKKLVVSGTESLFIGSMRETLSQLLIQIQKGPTNNKLFSDETLNNLNLMIDAGVFAYDIYSSVNDFSELFLNFESVTSPNEHLEYFEDLISLMEAGGELYWVWDETNNTVVFFDNNNYGFATIGFNGKILNSCADCNYSSENAYIQFSSPINKLKVYNTTTYQEIKAFTSSDGVGQAPSGANFNPTGSKMYICNGYSDNLTVINTTTNATVTNVNVGDYPVSILFHPSGSKYYVAHLQSNDIYVMDANTDTRTKTIQCRSSLRDMTISSDGTTLYCAAYGIDSVLIINTSSDEIINRISVGDGPYSLLLQESQNQLFVSNSGSNTLSKINLLTNSVTPILVGTHPYLMRFNASKNSIYLNVGGENKVKIINPSTGTILDDIQVGATPTGMSMDFGHNRLWVSNPLSGSISIIDLTLNEVDTTLITDNAPYCSTGDFIFQNPSANPCNNTEICDGLDNDCDGQIDEGLAFPTWYQDQDGDTYGNSMVTITACTKPMGYVLNQLDCDDTNSLIHPGASDNTCNDIDEDCDGISDDDYFGTNCLTCQNGQLINLSATWFLDADGDGHAISSIVSCITPGIGYGITVKYINDCNDNNANIHPGASDANCNGIDEDCDNVKDDNYSPISCLVCEQGQLVSTAPTLPVASLLQPTCQQPMGSITITNKVLLDSVSFNNGTNYQISNTKTNLNPGTYQLKIKNTSGCSSMVTTAILNPASINVQITNLSPMYFKSSPPFILTGTPAGGEFRIDGNLTLGNAFSPILLSVGTHTVTYRVIQATCTSTVSQQTTVMPASNPTNPNQCYTIENYRFLSSGNVAGIQNASTANNAALQQQNSVGQLHQKWSLENLSNGFYRIQNKASGFYLRVLPSGALVQSSYSSPSANWKLQINNTLGTFNIINQSNNRYLTANQNNTLYRLAGASLVVIPGLDQNFRLNTVNCTNTEPIISINPELSYMLTPLPKIKIFKKGNIEVFPNPNSGRLTIEFSEFDPHELANISICDIHGRKIWEIHDMSLRPSRFTVDLNRHLISNGLYILYFRTQSQIFEKKILIQR